MAQRQSNGHRTKLILAAVLIAVLVTGASVSRCVQVHFATEETSEGGEAVSSEANESADDKDGLTDGQEALIADYGDDEEELVETLESWAWTARLSGVEVTFAEHSAEISDTGGSRRTESLAIDALAVATATDGSRAWTARLLFADGKEGDLKVTETVDTAGEPAYTLECTRLSASVLASTPLEIDLDVDLPSDEVMKQTHAKGDEIEAALESYARTAAPTAKTATWQRDLILDYSEGSGTARMTFSLDDAASTLVVIEINLGTGSAHAVEG